MTNKDLYKIALSEQLYTLHMMVDLSGPYLNIKTVFPRYGIPMS